MSTKASMSQKNKKTSVVRGYAALTVPGKSRTLNEDFYLTAPEHALYGLADGYGGTNVGDQAAKQVLDHIKFFAEHGLGDSEVTLPFVYRSYYTASGNLLFNAFLYANAELVKKNQSQHINVRGGASVVFVYFQGSLMTVANVGNCHVLIVRNGECLSLFSPRAYHFLKGRTVSTEWNPYWAFPLMSLGHAKDLEPEIIEFQVQPKDMVFLMTDGISAYLKNEEFSQSFSMVKDFLEKGLLLDAPIREQNQRLIQVAQGNGSDDNQAIVSMVCA